MNFLPPRLPAPALAAALAILALAACAGPPAPTRIDNLPMYGQPEVPRPTMFQQADAAFIANAASGFGGDRKLASLAWTDQGDHYLAGHNLDYAMRRYNQAWLLNPANFEVYWGFARVLLEQEKYAGAIPQLKKALELCTDSDPRAALLAHLGVAYSGQAGTFPPDRARERAAAFVQANEAFAESTTADPRSAAAWRSWTLSLIAEGDYTAAADTAARAEKLGADPLPLATRALLRAHAVKP